MSTNTGMRIVLITSNQRRHHWLAGQLAQVGELSGVVAESKSAMSPATATHPHPEVADYFRQRDETESIWFSDAPSPEALGVPVRQASWQQGSSEETVRFVLDRKPDVLILFGSSIIREPLLTLFDGQIINMHLGLSPYYRGSATNFWPLVDGLPECVGVTIHHATLKVDAGAVLMQARPDAAADDNSHDLGCKSVIAGARCLQALLSCPGPVPSGRLRHGDGRLCRRDDFRLEALRRLRDNLAAGMLSTYLEQKAERDASYPILETPAQPADSTSYVMLRKE